MFNWRSRNVECVGSVLFRGSIPPRLENLSDQFEAAGVDVQPVEHGDAHWAAELVHPEWGRATAVCLRNPPRVPREMVQFDPRLMPQDREDAIAGRSTVTLQMTGNKQDVLRDRKLLLRFLGCVMGDDGLVAADHLACKFWTREALDDELAHDADLDIDSLFISHLIHEEQSEEQAENESDEDDDERRPRVYWAHTHGLAELGAFDFDILRPSPLLLGAGYDLFRAIAFLILEGRVGPDTEKFDVILPEGPVSFVPVEEFNRYGPADERALRDDPSDPVHNTKRLILCDPRKKNGLLGRLFGGGRSVRASRLLSTIEDDGMMCVFTTSASELMALRARKTIEVFRRLSEEFAEFEVKPLVKLGYRTDGGDASDREHLWFEVHSIGSGTVEATLLNDPFYIQRLKSGDRGTHDLDLLTDWMVLTPAGSITPRQMVAARVIRTHRDELRKAMKGEGE